MRDYLLAIAIFCNGAKGVSALQLSRDLDVQYKTAFVLAHSGADNFRPDVAKVETLLGDAGYYKPLTNDGPNGWHNSNLDQAIRTFQKDKGLEVDGFLKPGGPTIGKIGSLLGGGEAQGQNTSNPSAQTQGFWGGPKGDWPGVLLPGDDPQSPRRPGGRDPGSFDPPGTFPMPKPQPPSNGSNLPGGELTPQQQLEALIRIMNGGKTPDPRPQPPVIEERPQSAPPRLPPIGNDLPEQGGITGTLPRPHDWDRLLRGHTINQDGIDANQGYAEMLVRDSDPSQTARTLKRAIDDYGDQGRGDVADLLARFQKIDGAKAETLRRELHKATGEVLPYRLAPLGEGFREPTGEEKIAAAPKTPFSSAQGADRWAAGNMAEVLLGKGNYADAITHFRGEIGRDRAEAMPYLAAVHEIMGEKNPAQAASFATQMQKAGLAAGPEEEKPEAATKSAPTPTPSPAPQPPKSEPAPQSEPSKPGQPQTPDITKKPEESAGKDTKSGDVVWRPGAPNSIPTIDKKTGKVVFVDGQTGKPVPGPVMVDKNSGTPVLAPDGKPYQTGGGRTEELLELSKKLAAQDPATMTPGQLEQWRRDMTNMREFLRLPNTDDEGWNRPRGPKEGERPQVPVGEPRQPPVEGAPLSEKTKAGEAFEALDKWFKDLKNSPPFSETPPLDPPPPSGPSPLPTGRSRPVPRLRPRRR